MLLTGGDPLLMSTRRLVEILRALRDIPHVRIIRIGSKMPAFDPWRLLRDEELQAAFRKYSEPTRRPRFVMSHETGKIEILAVDEDHIYVRYHRAKNGDDRGRFMIYERNDEAVWLDDLVPVNEAAPSFEPSPLLEVLAGPG